MRTAFSSRRAKARKITQDDSDDEPNGDTTSATTLTPSTEPPKPKPKKRSTPKLSFPSTHISTETEDPEPEFTVKKSALSRKAAERNARKKSGFVAGVVGMERLNIVSQERPSYSAAELASLRSVTATEPEEVAGEGIVVVDDDTLMHYTATPASPPEVEAEVEAEVKQTHIPSAAEISLLKAQRSAKAFFEATPKTGDSFSDNDDEILLRSKSKKKHSRLARDPLDEEEVDAYDNSDPLLLSQDPKLLKAAARNRKQNIQATILDAENSDSDTSQKSLDDWERSQIRKGAFSENIPNELETLSRQPDIIAPLPNLKDAVERLEGLLEGMALRKERTTRLLEELVEERKEISEREMRVQDELKRAGEEYERLNKKVGLAGVEEGGSERGLESFGNTPVRVEGGSQDGGGS